MVFQKLSVYEDNILTSNKNNTRATLNISIQAQFNLRVISSILGNVEQIIEIEKFISLFPD